MLYQKAKIKRILFVDMFVKRYFIIKMDIYFSSENTQT